MLFTNMFYKPNRTSLSKLRQHQSPQLPVNLPTNPPDWSSEDHADLLSKDKSKMKDAIKRYLAGKVRNDWVFEWPPIAVKETPTAIGNGQKQQQHPETLEPRDSENIQDEPNDDDGYQVDEDSDVAGSFTMEDNDNDAQSIYSIMSADPVHYKARNEWDSDVPVDEPSQNGAMGPEGQGADIQVSDIDRQAQKRRDLRKEMEWNEGLACFEARRNAWTHARTVRLRVKPETPPAASSHRTSRRFFFRRSISSASSQGANSHSGASTVLSEGSPPAHVEKDADRQQDKASTSTASADIAPESYPVQTIVPVPPPILPPNNPLRASITSGNYLQLYDKLIANNLQPSCPVNLSDMIGACVAGWKRDGEWPPRPVLPIDPSFNSNIARQKNKKKRASIIGTNDNPNGGRRMSLTGLLSRDRDSESRTGKGVRQSLQKALGIGSAHIDGQVTAEKAAHC